VPRLGCRAAAGGKTPKIHPRLRRGMGALPAIARSDAGQAAGTRVRRVKEANGVFPPNIVGASRADIDRPRSVFQQRGCWCLWMAGHSGGALGPKARRGPGKFHRGRGEWIPGPPAGRGPPPCVPEERLKWKKLRLVPGVWLRTRPGHEDRCGFFFF